MIRKIEAKNMGKSNLGWLKSHFHFSFAEYYNPENISFGALRVINDDLIAPQTGFDTHPHKDMEIVTYIIDGELTHKDSMGNARILKRGEVQYMSAGMGVFHSEHNLGDETLRLLQVWILPDALGYEPNYGEYKYKWEERENEWLNIVSSKLGNSPIKINQDFNIFVISMDAGKETVFEVKENRQAYVVQIEGSSDINNLILNERDALETVEESLIIKAEQNTHLIVFEMEKK